MDLRIHSLNKMNCLLLATGHVLHESTICRSLKRLGMTRQKIQHLALQRCDCQHVSIPIDAIDEMVSGNIIQDLSVQ